MAQKSSKVLATRNSSRLNTTHLITLTLHVLFLIVRALTFRSSFTRTSLILYILVWIPGFFVEWSLETSGRPKYTTYDPSASSTQGTSNVVLKSPGEDLDQSGGVMEAMWDLLYWTWGCTVFSAVLGDWGWSLWLVVPAYAAYKAFGLYSSAKGMAGGMQGEEQGSATGTSKRQQKLEKRGQRKVVYS